MTVEDYVKGLKNNSGLVDKLARSDKGMVRLHTFMVW